MPQTIIERRKLARRGGCATARSLSRNSPGKKCPVYVVPQELACGRRQDAAGRAADRGADPPRHAGSADPHRPRRRHAPGVPRALRRKSSRAATATSARWSTAKRRRRFPTTSIRRTSRAGTSVLATPAPAAPPTRDPATRRARCRSRRLGRRSALLPAASSRSSGSRAACSRPVLVERARAAATAAAGAEPGGWPHGRALPRRGRRHRRRSAARPTKTPPKPQHKGEPVQAAAPRRRRPQPPRRPRPPRLPALLTARSRCPDRQLQPRFGATA